MNTISPTIKTHDRIVYISLLPFLVINLFFPAWNTDYGLYYCSFILANAVAVIFILLSGFLRPTSFQKARSISILLVLIILYLFVNMYVSIKYHPWFWDLVNKTISFSFLLAFIFKCDHEFIHRYRVIETILIIAALSSLCSIFFYFAGYDVIDFRDFEIELSKLGEYGYYSDLRLTWIYLHKSTHSMMLLLFSALGLRYLDRFKHKLIPLGCLVIFAIAMYLSNTMVAIAGLVLIYAGYFMYRLLQCQNKKLKILSLSLLVGGSILAAVLLLIWISSERTLGDLGSRIPIWKASLQAIGENPMGVGSDFSKIILWGQANNCHSSFLNEIFRFSIPVGGLYTCIFLFMMCASMWKRNFFSLAVWGAFMIAINMDYALQAQTLSFVLILLYLIFFYEDESIPS